MSPSDFGNYTCEASNRFGSANATVHLYSSSMPICPPVCGRFKDLVAAAGGASDITAVKSLVVAMAAIVPAYIVTWGA